VVCGGDCDCFLEVFDGWIDVGIDWEMVLSLC